MKTLILRASAAMLALAAGAAVGCSSGGCGGGTNINSDSSSNPSAVSMQCGNGTYLNAQHQCVPIPRSNNGTTTQAQRSNFISN